MIETYLEIFNTEQSRINFIKGLTQLASSVEETDNGNVNREKEFNFLENFLSLFNISKEGQESIKNFINSDEKIVNIKFDSKKQAIAFFIEAMNLCYIDDEFQVQEKELIFNIADKLKITKESIIKIEEWILQGKRWSNEYFNLLDLE